MKTKDFNTAVQERVERLAATHSCTRDKDHVRQLRELLLDKAYEILTAKLTEKIADGLADGLAVGILDEDHYFPHMLCILAVPGDRLPMAGACPEGKGGKGLTAAAKKLCETHLKPAFCFTYPIARDWSRIATAANRAFRSEFEHLLISGASNADFEVPATGRFSTAR